MLPHFGQLNKLAPRKVSRRLDTFSDAIAASNSRSHPGNEIPLKRAGALAIKKIIVITLLVRHEVAD